METEKSEATETLNHVSASKSAIQLDFKRMVKLLTNPLDSLKLSDKDFLYGVIGLASSYVGYLLWSLLAAKKLDALLNPFNALASMLGGSRSSAFFAMFSKLLLTGLWSIVVLLGVVWLVGWWKGGSQQEIKQFITRIGGLHYIGAAGFLLACIVSSSIALSALVLAVTLLTLLVLTLYAGAEICGVPREKLSLYFLISIAGYVLLVSFLPQMLF